MPGFNPDAIIATGYYRLGIWDDEPADPLQAIFDGYDDLVATTGQAFLGTTFNCARCHDHKVDPIPQTDYYKMVAFFRDIRPYSENRDVRSAFNLTDITPPEAAREVRGGTQEAKGTVGRDQEGDGGDRGRGHQDDAGRGPARGRGARPAAGRRARCAKLLAGKIEGRVRGPDAGAQGTGAAAGPAGPATGAVGQQLRSAPAGRRTCWCADRPTPRARTCSPVSPRCSACLSRSSPLRKPGAKIKRPAHRACRLDRVEGQPVHRAGVRQPRLAVPLRPGHRPLGQRFRQARRAADAPGTARLAGQRVHGGRLEAEAPAQAHHDVERLPAFVARPTPTTSRPIRRTICSGGSTCGGSRARRFATRSSPSAAA